MQTVRTPDEAIEDIFSHLQWFYTFDKFGVQHGIFLGIHKGIVVCYFGVEFMWIYFNPTTAKFIFHSDLRDRNENHNAFLTLLEKVCAVCALQFHNRQATGIARFLTMDIDDANELSFAIAQKIYDENNQQNLP